MRPQTALLPLLAATTASAFPRPQGHHQQNSGAPAPCMPGATCGGALCEIEFTTGDAALAAINWEMVDGESRLRDLLADGVEGWTDRMFEQSGIGGSHGGSSYNCKKISSTQCGTTGECSQYTPRADFYIHTSLANLYSAFNRIHEALQNTAILGLSKGIKDIEATFGPQPADTSLITILNGVMIFGAGLAGPHWVVSSPLTGMVGLLNVASGIASREEVDVESELEAGLGDLFASYQTALEKAVGMIFAGDIDGEKGVEDPEEWILGTFDQGKLLDHDVTDPAVDGWIEGMREAITKVLVIQALKHNGYFVWVGSSHSQETCEDEENGHYVWFGDGDCRAISKRKTKSGSHGLTVPVPMPDEMYDAFTGKYGFNYGAVIQNAVECNDNGGGNPNLGTWPGFNDDNEFRMPACFANFRVDT